MPQLSIIQYAKGTLLVFVLLCCVLTIAQAQRVYQYLEGVDLQSQLYLLGLGLVGLQEVLLPSAMFVGAIFVCRKMWRRGYILTLLTLGYSPWALGKGIGVFAVLMSCLVGLCTHSAGPQALSALRQEFTEAFESGQVYPLSFLKVGAHGALAILPDTKEAVGVLKSGGQWQLLYAQRSDYRGGDGDNWLTLTDVEFARDDVLITTQSLNLKVPTHVVSAFPKVLRGTKLVVSSKLDLRESRGMFSFVRRWVLTTLPLVLVLFAMALPGLLSDSVLAFVTTALLASVHVYFRWVEVMALSVEMNVAAGIFFTGALSAIAVLSMRRAFWLGSHAS